MGQSFTPGFSSIRYVSLYLYDGGSPNNAGGIVLVNLRSNSISGPIIDSTAPLFLPGNFVGITNFLFSTSVGLVAGTKYFLQPIISSGNPGIGSYVTDGSYTGGTGFYLGAPVIGRNLWFQEGVFGTPEPASAALVLLGGGAWLLMRRKRVQ